MHVGDVEPGDRADAHEQGRRALGRVGVDVHLQRPLVADDEHRVADRLERLDPRGRIQPLAGDGEVRAVAERRGLVLRVRDAGRRVVVELRRLGAAQRGDDAGEDHGEAEAAGVDHAGLAQDREQVGTAPDRLLAGVERALEHLGDQRVLALDVALLQPRLLHVRELGRDAVRHLAHHGEDRALGRLAHRVVRAVGGARHRRADQHRVDQLAGTRGQLLGGAADQLGEDHAGVAARARAAPRGRRSRRSRRGRPRRGAVAREPVELVEHGAQRERHVVARVAVGDREHVEVVDLLAACLQLRQRALDDGAEADEARIGQGGRRATPW